ncbi:MAG: EpsG family protein [Nitrospirae bacterium]|nr:EpsG family protein [Nitrospirota bacterium]
MIIYFVLLLIVITSIYFAHRLTAARLPLSILYFIALAAMVIVAGLRSSYVGTDSGNYVRWFEHLREFSDIFEIPLEPGFFILAWTAHFISDNYMALFFLIAMVVTSCFVWVIRKYSSGPELSFFVLLVAGYLFVSYNGIRHGLANSIYFLSIGAIYRRKFWLYLLVVAAAYFFHKSVLIALPAYFLITRKSTPRIYFIILLSGIVGVLFFEYFIEIGQYIDPRYGQYGEASEEGLGLLSLAFTSTLCAFFLMFKRFVVVDRDKYDALLNMFLLATVIAIASAILETSASGIRRLGWYFTLSEILLWPIVYQNIRNRQRPIFLFYFVPLYLMYYGMSLTRFSNMVPYTFNPALAEWVSRIGI